MFICRDNYWQNVQSSLILVTASLAGTESELYSSKAIKAQSLYWWSTRCNFSWYHRSNWVTLAVSFFFMYVGLWATNKREAILSQLNNHLWRVLGPVVSANGSLVSLRHTSAAPTLPRGISLLFVMAQHTKGIGGNVVLWLQTLGICAGNERLSSEKAIGLNYLFPPVQSILLSTPCGILETPRAILKTRATTCCLCHQEQFGEASQVPGELFFVLPLPSSPEGGALWTKQLH